MTHSLRQSAVAESQTIGRRSRPDDHIPGSVARQRGRSSGIDVKGKGPTPTYLVGPRA
jgi:hypothetical protein